MAGSLCLPVCFIAVVCCFESIFVYQISILRMAGEGRVKGEGAALQFAGPRSCLLPHGV